MKTFSLIAAFAVTVTAVLTTNHCHAQWPGTTRGSNHRRSLEIGGRAYSRPGTDSDIPIITDAETGSSIFDAEQATNGGSAPGLEIKYRFTSPANRQWEFRTIVADFETDTEVNGPGLASTLFPAGGVGSFNYEYDTRLLSFELTTSRSLASGINLSYGPRYINFRENVTTTAQSAGPVAAIGLPAGAPVETVIDQEATNGLIGLQAGLDFTFPVAQQVYTTAFIRTGGYYNPTETSRSQNSFQSGALFDSLDDIDDSKSTGSFLAEVGGRVYVDLYEDAVSAFFGYEATWIDGIATAPAAFLSTPGTGVDTANTIFFHAITFGIRMDF